MKCLSEAYLNGKNLEKDLAFFVVLRVKYEYCLFVKATQHQSTKVSQINTYLQFLHLQMMLKRTLRPGFPCLIIKLMRQAVMPRKD